MPAPNATILGIDASRIAQFVGPKADYYDRKWRELEIKKSAVSWNWAAFFLGPLWLAYRRMYLLASLLIVLMFCSNLALILLSADIDIVLGLILGIVQMILLGMFGNALYRKHVTGEVALIESLHQDDMARAVALARKGGRSLPAAFGFAVLCVVAACRAWRGSSQARSRSAA